MNKCVLDFFTSEPKANVTHVKQPSDLNRQLQSYFDKFFVIIFYSYSNEQSLNLCETVHAVSQLNKTVMFNFIEIENNDEIGEFFNVEVVPSIYFVTASKQVQTKIDNPDLSSIEDTINAEYSLFQENFRTNQERIFPRLELLLKEGPVMVFMKGSPDQPKCGFSRQLVTIFKDLGIQYNYFDILGDLEVREWLKYYSNWKSYPQLYVNAKLIGGLDVIKNHVQNDTLMGLLPSDCFLDFKAKISQLINQERVLLVTHWLSQHSALEDILKQEKIKYSIADISNDAEFVDYIKESFQLPFLVGNNQMLGGEQQVRQLVQSGQLRKALGEANFNQ